MSFSGTDRHGGSTLGKAKNCKANGSITHIFLLPPLLPPACRLKNESRIARALPASASAFASASTSAPAATAATAAAVVRGVAALGLDGAAIVAPARRVASRG
jgi:hypothetical protein